ncbi:MAG: hypothetical protein WAM14_25505 [Candidatus Nitrosopolaris sp.]
MFVLRQPSSNDYKYGWEQAVSDGQNSVNGTNRERTVCAVGSRDNYYQEPINSTNACYAGYYDSYVNMCLS